MAEAKDMNVTLSVRERQMLASAITVKMRVIARAISKEESPQVADLRRKEFQELQALSTRL